MPTAATSSCRIGPQGAHVSHRRLTARAGHWQAQACDPSKDPATSHLSAGIHHCHHRNHPPEPRQPRQPRQRRSGGCQASDAPLLSSSSWPQSAPRHGAITAAAGPRGLLLLLGHKSACCALWCSCLAPALFTCFAISLPVQAKHQAIVLLPCCLPFYHHWSGLRQAGSIGCRTQDDSGGSQSNQVCPRCAAAAAFFHALPTCGHCSVDLDVEVLLQNPDRGAPQ